MVVKANLVIINILTTSLSENWLLFNMTGVHVALIKRLSLMIAFSLSLFSASSFAQDYSEGAIADRIAPIGDVYIDGEIVTAS